MMKLVECVPNFSEGNDLGVIKQITDQIETVEGVKLLDVDPGKATNRTVVTLAFAASMGRLLQVPVTAYRLPRGQLWRHCLATGLLAARLAPADATTSQRNRIFTAGVVHDIGKLLFAFVVFWAYIAFSQYMLIWYGNIPEETEWFYHRQLGAWGVLALGLIFFHLPWVTLR